MWALGAKMSIDEIVYKAFAFVMILGMVFAVLFPWFIVLVSLGELGKLFAKFKDKDKGDL